MNKYAIIFKNEYGYSMPIIEAKNAEQAQEIAETHYTYLGEVVGRVKLDK